MYENLRCICGFRYSINFFFNVHIPYNFFNSNVNLNVKYYLIFSYLLFFEFYHVF